MKIIYFILILALLYVVVGYTRYKYILAHVNLDVILQQDRKLGAGPELRYIAAGDSTALGEGASKVEKTYPYRVAEYLAQKNTVSYKNVAATGAKTQDLIGTQLKAIIDFNPDVVTISIGANDVTHYVSKNKTIENYLEIIKQLTENTKAKIYITDVARFDHSYLLPYLFREYFDLKAKSLNRELLKLGTDRVKIIDIHSVAVDNSRDQFHPSDSGYDFWTNAFLDKIKTDFQ
jgi:lysophospholipase L1-like esterase